MNASISVATKPAPGAVRKISGEFLRYVMAGVAATLMDFAVLTLLIEMLSLHYLLANTCSFIAASAISYLLSIAWVFRTNRKSNRCREFLFFTLIGVGGLLISQACMYVMIEFLNYSYHFGKLAAVGGTLFWNFGIKKALLFRGTS
jgi:putative flippase GtrA